MLPEISGSIFIPKTSLAKFILCAEAHFMRGKRISFAEAYFMHVSAFHSSYTVGISSEAAASGLNTQSKR
jgi:hypothetical protein